MESFTKLVNTYPQAKLADDGLYELGVLYGDKMDQSDNAAAAFNKLATQYPDSPFVVKAREQIAAMELKKTPIQRQYDTQYVNQFTVAREEYDDKDRLRQYILIVQNLSEREIKATLEDALIKSFAKRRDPKHRIKIEAFNNYPGREVASVTWAPDEQPNYKIEKVKSEDVAKDLLFELLRGNK